MLEKTRLVPHEIAPRIATADARLLRLAVCVSREDRRVDAPRGFLSGRSLKALQTNISRAGPAATVSYTLIGAILLFGGIGYAVDEWRGTSPWFLFGGLILGLIVGFYELARALWWR